MENSMKTIRIEKITLNVGAGKEQGILDKGMKLLKNITGISPIKTITQKRIPGWGIRPGLPVGCKITLRKEKVKPLLIRLLSAKDGNLNNKCFDDNGNVAFGIPEYIDITDAKYDPEIGIMGLEVCVTLERAGFRIKKRRIRKGKIHKNHRISKKEAIEFMKKEFNTNVGE